MFSRKSLHVGKRELQADDRRCRDERRRNSGAISTPILSARWRTVAFDLMTSSSSSETSTKLAVTDRLDLSTL